MTIVLPSMPWPAAKNRNGTMVNRRRGERADFKRRRMISYAPHSVVTDGLGNILDRPLTEGLPCFADPVEVLFGLNDEPSRFGDREPQAKGCAKCPVRAFCHTVAYERIQSSPQLVALSNGWERDTVALPVTDRYMQPGWAAFVAACETHSWSDCNEMASIEAAEQKAETKRLRQAQNAALKRRGNKKRVKIVPSDLADKITAYRDERVIELVLISIGPKSPLWIRNRSQPRIALFADVWMAREMLGEAGMRTSGTAVAEWLRANGRKPSDAPMNPVSYTKLIEQTLRRVDHLLSVGTWPEFDPRPAPTDCQIGRGMHPAAVIQLLDP